MATITGTINPDILNGTEDDDVIYGLDGDDTLNGLGGDDYLHGGLGADTMAGGIGNDDFVIDSFVDVVIENPDGGEDQVYSVLSYTLGANVEDLVLLPGFFSYNGTGNELDNHL